MARDHPRSRGVYSSPESADAAMAGSSPLARGLRLGDTHDRRPEGIIPARAGFTGRRYGDSPAGRDHPRSRGVYTSRVLALIVAGGSSPLARGLHLWIPGIPTTSHTTRPRLPSLPT